MRFFIPRVSISNIVFEVQRAIDIAPRRLLIAYVRERERTFSPSQNTESSLKPADRGDEKITSVVLVRMRIDYALNRATGAASIHHPPIHRDEISSSASRIMLTAHQGVVSDGQGACCDFEMEVMKSPRCTDLFAISKDRSHVLLLETSDYAYSMDFERRVRIGNSPE